MLEVPTNWWLIYTPEERGRESLSHPFKALKFIIYLYLLFKLFYYLLLRKTFLIICKLPLAVTG